MSSVDILHRNARRKMTCSGKIKKKIEGGSVMSILTNLARNEEQKQMSGFLGGNWGHRGGVYN
ncbi:unnamed protein product [Dovyalis caffra]|uniref:Uncharacterized protein n=1 Tax=Dovyalis caffra TaxID=77055 RepID=A0AAV1RC14_9ROSI|nr:unnamed protein product [Dovyalis caffra]